MRIKLVRAIRKPFRLEVWTAMISIAVTLALLLTLLPIQASINTGGLLSIDLGFGKVQAQIEVPAYGQVNKSGCTIRKGNCQIRIDFYLEPESPRYSDKYLYLVDETSPEYLAGYSGKVDKDGNPINQVQYDKWLESLPRAWVNTPFHTHFIYLPADFTNKDIEDAIALHLPNFYKAFVVDRWDEVQGGMRHGWDTATRIRPTDYSKTENPAQYDARVAECEAAVDSLTEFSYKPIGESGQGETFPATEIDIGDAAANRVSSVNIKINTAVNKGNPADGTGAISSYEIWIQSKTGTTDVWVGTFSASGDTLTCNDSESIGDIASGSKQTGSGLDIDVNSGEYFGAYSKSGTICSIERALSGEDGIWYTSGEYIDPDDSAAFTFYAGDAISLYGTGETAAPPSPEITNTPDNYGFGTLQIGSSSNTSISYFTTNNTGNCAVDVTIQGTDLTNTTVYEEYLDSSQTNNIYDVLWQGQTFTPSISHNVTSAWLMLARAGSPGTVTVSIRATSAGKPTGGDLCSGTTDGDTLTTNATECEWRQFTFSSGYYLSADTQYAIVARAIAGNTSNWAYFKCDYTSPSYAGGTKIYSGDSGVNWTTESNGDTTFMEYGTLAWTLSGTATPEENIYGLHAGLDDDDDLFDTVVNLTANAFITNLSESASQDWGLNLSMPDSLSGYNNGQMTGTITLVASAA